TDAAGQLRLVFNIGGWIQPGNNWRIVASGHEEELDRVKPLAMDWQGSLFYDKNQNDQQDGDEIDFEEFSDPSSQEGFKATTRLTVWRKLHVEVDSMGLVDETNLPPDDLLTGDVPDPDVDGMQEAFEDAFILVDETTIDYDDGQTEWRHSFGDRAEVDDYILDTDGLGPPGTRDSKDDETAGYWVVYIIGIYERADSGYKDNDPNGEEALLGFCNFADGEPEWSYVSMEILRDVGEDQWGWSEEERIHAGRIVAAHEIAHQFQLEHESGNFPNHLMTAPSEETEEELIPQTPLQFRESDLRDIREKTVTP
ncbi:MAG: hypothetical protein ACYTG0_26685, partial [Planctomycetota bacterium]